ncbi:MAG: response regulator transcription factor [Phycisphaerales bacterium]|nr:response regulator transcription factor [Phycisphaerales bacterium]
MIRVLIIDNRALLREGLRLVIDREDDLTVVQTVGRVEDIDAARIGKTCNVAVINIDSLKGEVKGKTTLLRRRFPDIGIVALSKDWSDRAIAQLLEAKVQGLVINDEEPKVVCDAIRGVFRGEYCYSRRARDRVADADGEAMSGSERTRLQQLTKRELELLRLLASGLSLKAAGEEMQVSYKTADKHRVNLMRKLEIHDRVALARYAIREGIVDP